MTNIKKKIMIISMAIIVVGFMVNLWWSFTQYPQIQINRQTLYGESNQNLKDFEVVGDGLISVSSDPWIEYFLQEPIKIKVVELNILGVTESGSWGDVYSRNAENWERQSYDLKNGKILLLFDDNVRKESLRFDLVSTNSTYLEVGSIIVNSRYGLAGEDVRKWLMILLYIIIYEEEIFRLFYCIKNDHYNNKKKIFAVGCMIYPFLLLMTLALNFIKTDVSKALFTWMYSISIVGMLTVIFETRDYKEKHLIIEILEVFLVAFMNVGIIEIMSGIEYNFENPAALFMNIILSVFPIVFFSCIFRRIKWGMLTSNIIFGIVGIINHYYYLFRNQPFELTDFLMANTALTVLENYVFEIDYRMFFFILAEIGMICYLAICNNEKADNKELFVSGILGFPMAVAAVIYSPTVNYWDMSACVQEYGYLNTFIAYVKNDFFHDKPNGYSVNAVKDILGTYTDERENQMAEEYPNIIVIMNEAFSDLPNIYEFETTEDGMPFIHSMSKNTVKGNLLVSVFGGNTANTEYEFLTGNTMAFMGGKDVPYVQFVKRKQVNSLTYELKSLGYQTIAFHPYAPKNYNRDKVYPLLGFDEFISQNNELAYNESFRTWMSDRSDFYNVIDIFEKRDKDAPFYMFNVTMQNHGGYSSYQSEIDITVKPVKEEYQNMQLMEYLSLIRETDAAFEELTEYFENIDEKTIILMFGDHQPGLDAEVYNILNYGKEVNMQKKYIVPFIMWANYEIESKSNVLASPNYLRTMLLESANIPFSRYDRFLSECYSEYPAINSQGLYDSAGNLYKIEEISTKKLNDYQILQYANVFDKTTSKYFDIQK